MGPRIPRDRISLESARRTSAKIPLQRKQGVSERKPLRHRHSCQAGGGSGQQDDGPQCACRSPTWLIYSVCTFVERMQGCGSSEMQAALRGGLAVARQALPVQRLIGGTKAVRRLTTYCHLPSQAREGSSRPRQRAGLASGALPRAAAVEAPTASSVAAQGEHKAAASAPTFQEAIARLQEYWAGVGCAVWLPHNTEVGRLHQREL